MIGVSSLCMLQSPLETVLETVGSTFSHVEVVCEGNHDNLEILKSYNYTVSFHAPFSDLNTASLNKAILKESLKQITECIREANTYNAETVCIHPGHFSPMGSRFTEKVFTIHKESLKELTSRAEDSDVFLGIENMPMFSILCGRTAEEIEEILCVADSDHFGFTFDVGHANTAGGPYPFLTLKEYMRTVHLHDNCGKADTHLPLGEGTLDLNIIKELKEKRLVIEVYTFADAQKSLSQVKTLLSV